jgi:DNA-binding NarL/FixJ family response regulator
MNAGNELTTQERKVLMLVAQGKRNAAIANDLTISVRTVETHLYRIFDKLGVSSRVEAALYLLQHRGPSELYVTKEVSGISDDTVVKNNYSGS